MVNREALLRILDQARWAPSGDNTQPWRFEIVADGHIVVHGSDTREWCLYDLDGHASHMAHGALLETMRIAATAHGLKAAWSIREGGAGGDVVYDVVLSPAEGLPPDPLYPFIETRSVQRRRLKTTPLSDEDRAALNDCVGPHYSVRLYESWTLRRRIARLLWANAGIRLSCPEAYLVHRDIIEWGARFSEDRIPEQAVGVDPVTAGLMRWAMKSWTRVDFLNRYLMGTIPPRILLDVLPALSCAAHALIVADREPRTVADHVDAGVAMQRFWLTAESRNLRLQPQMTPLIFSWYAAAGRSLSLVQGLDGKAAELALDMGRVLGPTRDAVFFCRVGRGSRPDSRSTRRTTESLILGPLS